MAPLSVPILGGSPFKRNNASKGSPLNLRRNRLNASNRLSPKPKKSHPRRATSGLVDKENISQEVTEVHQQEHEHDNPKDAAADQARLNPCSDRIRLSPTEKKKKLQRQLIAAELENVSHTDGMLGKRGMNAAGRGNGIQETNSENMAIGGTKKLTKAQQQELARKERKQQQLDMLLVNQIPTDKKLWGHLAKWNDVQLIIGRYKTTYRKCEGKKEKGKIIDECLEDIHRTVGYFVKLSDGQWKRLSRKDERDVVKYRLKEKVKANSSSIAIFPAKDRKRTDFRGDSSQRKKLEVLSKMLNDPGFFEYVNEFIDSGAGSDAAQASVTKINNAVEIFLDSDPDKGSAAFYKSLKKSRWYKGEKKAHFIDLKELIYLLTFSLKQAHEDLQSHTAHNVSFLIFPPGGMAQPYHFDQKMVELGEPGELAGLMYMTHNIPGTYTWDMTGLPHCPTPATLFEHRWKEQGCPESLIKKLENDPGPLVSPENGEDSVMSGMDLCKAYGSLVFVSADRRNPSETMPFLHTFAVGNGDAHCAPPSVNGRCVTFFSLEPPGFDPSKRYDGTTQVSGAKFYSLLDSYIQDRFPPDQIDPVETQFLLKMRNMALEYCSTFGAVDDTFKPSGVEVADRARAEMKVITNLNLKKKQTIEARKEKRHKLHKKRQLLQKNIQDLMKIDAGLKAEIGNIDEGITLLSQEVSENEAQWRILSNAEVSSLLGVDSSDTIKAVLAKRADRSD